MQMKIGSQLTAYMLAAFVVTLLVPALSPNVRYVGAAHAQDTSTEQIIRSLKRRKTRGLRLNNSNENQAIQKLKRTRRTRGLSLSERNDLYEASREMQQIDLAIYFDINSAKISRQSRGTLQELGEALRSIDLEGDQFIVGGHTDRRGSRAYNEELSERRAEAVRRYLIRHFNIEPEALLAIGYGYDKLKNPDDPLADENRRVQLVNIGPIQ
jgi:outer membrane protein OmpA-like peptidoglycan-associated protein